MNEYRIERSEMQATQKAVSALIKEIENNLHTLEKWTPYHKEIADKTAKFIETGSDSVSQFVLERIIDSEKGIFRDILTKHAWMYLNLSNTKMDIKTRLMITRLYEQQKYVENALTDVLEFLKSRELYRTDLKEENYNIFLHRMRELHAQESAMIRSCQLTLDSIKLTQ